MKKLTIVSLMKRNKKEKWLKIQGYWEKYFYHTSIMDTPTKLDKYVFSKDKIDLLFLDFDSFKLFKTGYYGIFKEKERHFKYVLVGEKPSKEDIGAFKALADDIVYLNTPVQNLKWKSISILRRYWDTHSKKSTIIYKDIIADFMDRYVEVNRKVIKLTIKELELLKYFLTNSKVFISRETIFKDVWSVKDADTTRTVDQMLFKLKNKIGKEYFISSRTKGIKFE